MTITLATEPTYAVPGKAVRIAVSANGASVNWVRLWCTDAPPGSSLKAQLDASAAGRVLVGPDGFDPSQEGALLLDLDAPGSYAISGQEYVRGAASYGGGYAGSPDGFRSEAKVGAAQSLSVYAGERLVSRVGSAEYGDALLVVWVWNDTIRPTTVAAQGEKTPTIVSPRNDRARNASLAATVVSALATLENVTATSAVGSIDTLIAEIKTDFRAHMTTAGGIHSSADTVNSDAIARLSAAPTSPGGRARTVAALRAALYSHMGNLPSTATAYHVVGTANVPDEKNQVIASPAGSADDMASTLIALADLCRAWADHLASTAVHIGADSTNTLSTTLGALVSLHKAFLTAVQPSAPTAPASANSGAVVLQHGAGFRREARRPT